MLGAIYAGALSRFSNPVNLKRLVNLIDEIEWTALNIDVKAAAYEGLLEKSASEGKKGAGQYFTPRILIQSIVRCMKPDPRKRKGFTIHDPAAGTGGFLVCAYEWLIEQTKGGLERDEAKRILTSTYSGTELVPRPRRLALMNLYLHGIQANIYLGDAIYEPKKIPKNGGYECVMTNPPFGTKGANQAPNRDDFTVATSNKQLNFVQHVMSILKPGGRAAIVVPDNVLFADQAGEVFKILTEDCNLHTVLRLPNGTFTPYSPGTKTNVVFFTKGYSTENTWIYDARTNVPQITKKDRPLTPQYFTEFESCYGSDPNGHSKRNPKDLKEDRWRSFTINEIKERGFKIDSLKWLRDELLEDSDDLPDPQELATDAIAELEAVVDDLKEIVELVENEEGVEK
jgi:type I restriction enzyme M protein